MIKYFKIYRYLLVLFTCFLIIIPKNCFSQNNDAKSIKNIPSYYLSYGYSFPCFDLKQKFGSNSIINSGFMYKTKSNLIFGISGSLLFGDSIKYENFLSPIKTNNGYIIDKNGKYADVRLWERGYIVLPKIGYLINLKNVNMNSGLYFTLSPAFMQYKVRIETIGNNVPNLNAEYKKGYDRLTNGAAFNSSIGFVYYGNKKSVNFFLEIDLTIASTLNKRTYNFDLYGPDNTTYTDGMYGLKFGWILPLYKRVVVKEYLY